MRTKLIVAATGVALIAGALVGAAPAQAATSCTKQTRNIDIDDWADTSMTIRLCVSGPRNGKGKHTAKTTVTWGSWDSESPRDGRYDRFAFTYRLWHHGRVVNYETCLTDGHLDWTARGSKTCSVSYSGGAGGWDATGTVSYKAKKRGAKTWVMATNSIK